jgi:hypothetical protein
VRKVKKGFYLRRRKDEMQLVERRTSRIHKRSPVPDPSATIPQIGSGWITSSEWNRPPGASISRIYSEWTVPQPPITPNSGQTIFLFNSLENASRDEIVQPVLQFGSSAAGGGNGWWIGNWYVAPSGLATTSALVEVDPGDVVTGVVTLISQPSGAFTYVSQFLGHPEIDVTVPEIDELTWVCHTLEAYQTTGNDDYPGSPYTSMISIEIDLEQSTVDSVQWSVINPYAADGQRSNVSNPNNPGGEIDIFYR